MTKHGQYHFPVHKSNELVTWAASNHNGGTSRPWTQLCSVKSHTFSMDGKSANSRRQVHGQGQWCVARRPMHHCWYAMTTPPGYDALPSSSSPSPAGWIPLIYSFFASSAVACVCAPHWLRSFLFSFVLLAYARANQACLVLSTRTSIIIRKVLDLGSSATMWKVTFCHYTTVGIARYLPHLC